MNTTTYARFRHLIHARGGIDLGAQKQTLLCGRLAPRMRELDCPSYEDYLQRVTRDAQGTEVVHLLDAIATHHTFFFREAQHLESIRDLVASRIKAGQRRFRIWSAACSSGEEVWSLGMLLLDLIEQSGRSDIELRILATDISTKILRKAAQATYDAERVKFVDSELRKRYFRRSGSEADTRYTVCDRLKELVLFRRLNLSESPFPMKGPFDAILCRNVMIYFSEPVREQLVGECVSLLSPGSLFCVGLTESVLGKTSDLQFCGPSTYRRATADVSELSREHRC